MLTTYCLKLVSESIFKHQDQSVIPYDFYIALSTTTPQLDGTGVTEPTADTGYTRVRIYNDYLTFGEADDNGTVSNINAIYFPESIKPWGEITYYALFDAPTDGNLLMYGAFNEAIDIPIKTMLTIPANKLLIKAENKV